MDDLVTWLRAQLDEDERLALAATPGPWSVDNTQYAESIANPDGVHVVAGGRWGGEASVFETTEDALHIARHDPARVLREVEAKRRIIDDLLATPHWTGDGWYGCHGLGDSDDVTGEQRMTGPCTCGVADEIERRLRLLALPYADRPGYRDEWRPE